MGNIGSAVDKYNPAVRREAKAGGFWAHVAGTAYKMVVEHAVAGLRIDNYRTTLPFKKGLSSSAAVCVAVSSVASQQALQAFSTTCSDTLIVKA